MEHLPLMLRLLAATVLKKQHKALLAEIAFLRAENAFYRQQLPPKRYFFSVDRKRRFAETGKAVGWAKLKDFAVGAAAGTIQNWSTKLEKGLLKVPAITRVRTLMAQETEDLV